MSSVLAVIARDEACTIRRQVSSSEAADCSIDSLTVRFSGLMRVLQICSAREIGGGDKHLADLANALARRGHEVFAALSPGSPLTTERALQMVLNV